MELLSTKEHGRRCRLFAVAIFLGMSTATAQADAARTEFVYANKTPVIEMAFFDGGEFGSAHNFNEATITAAQIGATYWRDVLNMRASRAPWQIALTTNDLQLTGGRTFSFRHATPIQDNYLAQMLQNRRTLTAYDLRGLSGERITAEQMQAALRGHMTPAGDTAVSVLTVGDTASVSVDANTILPTNELAADLVGELRLEMARALGAAAVVDTTAMKFADGLSDPHAWTFRLVDANGNAAMPGKQIVTSADLADAEADSVFVADRTYFTGANVNEVLNGATFDGVSGIPLNGTFNETLIPGLMSGLPYKNYTTFTDLELAAMQDIGYNIDRKQFYGRSIYNSCITVNNADDYASDKPLAVGLHVWGTANDVTQSGDIALAGDGATGIRVDGLDNRIVIAQDTAIVSNGLRGKGLLVSYGRDHNFDVNGDITSAGNAVEFNFGSNMLGAGEYRGSYIRYLRGTDGTGMNLPLGMTEGFSYTGDELNGALVNEFNVSGGLAGGEHAIYIGKNALVKNINFFKGTTLSGDIVSDWKHFTAADGFTYPVLIQYGGREIDATKYIPGLVTTLNFNANMEYCGNISGADNIKMHVNAGTLKFFGAANVLGVEVGQGAKLYGGNFTLNNMLGNTAEGFEDWTTGKLINHGTIAADTPDTNLIINGDLVSDGTIQKMSGGTGGMIIVNGNADVNGSLVTTNSLTPNQTETVLIANSITGQIRNPLGNPVPISGLLTASGNIIGNTMTVTTYESNNLGDLEPHEVDTFNAMGKMYEKLEGEGLQGEMRSLYNLTPPEAKRTLTQISSNDSAQVMSVAQQSTAVDRMIADRVNRVFAPEFGTDYVDVPVRPMRFADDDNAEDHAPDMKVRVKVPSRQENNFWINYMKNWGSLRGGTDYHGSAIVAGYDRPFGKKFRAGVFATYGTIGYGVQSSRATVYDTRLGLYAGYHNKQSDVYFYINGGQLRNSLYRGLSSLGLSTHANYKSRIVEIGGEYKYDLQPRRKWHVSPYVNFQTSHLRQNSYNERGAGIYNQHVDARSNTYFAAQAGLDLKRYYRNGMFGVRFGVKHGFAGADPDLRITYEGDGSNSYRLRNKRDKTHFVFSVRGENEFASGWFLGGEAEYQRGDHDKDLTASLMLRRMW